MCETPSTPSAPDNYRKRLLPLIARWNAARERVAIFGTGPHTNYLFSAVPELGTLDLVAFLDSRGGEGSTHRGLPVHLPAWAEGRCEVVLCSSFANELTQMALLDGLRVKAVPSHLPSTSPEAPAIPSVPLSAVESLGILRVPTFGYDVARTEPEEPPIDAVTQLLDGNLASMQSAVGALTPFFAELASVPADATDSRTPYWNNGYFTGTDGKLAYATVRHRRPPRIVEIGSGNSTKFMRRAIDVNGGGTILTSIDPSPRTEIDQLCDRVLRTTLQDTPPGVFDDLAAGDVLFFDGSHLVFPGSDCVTFFLQILPRLARGVLVQVHDIYLPFGYPREFRERYYNEQYLLAAFLLGNRSWTPVVASQYLGQKGLLEGGNSSFWMIKDESTPFLPRPR
jgi:hypothetical protein